MNKTALFLRLAAVLTLVHAVLHTVGGVFGQTAPGAATIAVQAMKANEFLLMGRIRSYWAFHRGLGLGLTILLTAQSVVFWQLASVAKIDANRIRPLLTLCDLNLTEASVERSRNKYWRQFVIGAGSRWSKKS